MLFALNVGKRRGGNRRILKNNLYGIILVDDVDNLERNLCNLICNFKSAVSSLANTVSCDGTMDNGIRLINLPANL